MGFEGLACFWLASLPVAWMDFGLFGFLGLLFCNFIVDASIFVICFVASYLVCSVDALAPRADEGRGNLRYASGSW